MLRRAFTLIELLVVIAIIAILAAILFPVFAQAREKAREATSLSNVNQIGLGIIQYVQDYDETYPQTSFAGPPNYITTSWRQAVQPYIKNTGDVWVDPSNAASGLTNGMSNWWTIPDPTPVSYGANSDGMWNQADEVLYDNQTGGGGNNVNPMPPNITPMTSWASWTGTAPTGAMKDAGVVQPSSLILIGEVDTVYNWGDVQYDEYDTGNCSEAYPNPPQKVSDCAFPPNVYSGHNGLATYAFCDGHAKALRLTQTVAPVNLWDNIDIQNNAPADKAAQIYAAWAQDYWNLQ